MPKPVFKKGLKGTEKCLKEALEICPVQVFAEEKGKIVIKFPEKCIGCRACEAQCENGEITVVD